MCKPALMFTQSIIEIEGRLKERGIRINDFCEQAGVSRATWQRWKAGVVIPRADRWARVQEMAPGKGRRRAA